MITFWHLYKWVWLKTKEMGKPKGQKASFEQVSCVCSSQHPNWEPDHGKPKKQKQQHHSSQVITAITGDHLLASRTIWGSPTILGLHFPFLSTIVFKNQLFPPGVLMVFWKEGFLESMGRCPLEPQQVITC